MSRNLIPRYAFFRRKTNWFLALTCEVLAPILRAYAKWRCDGDVSAPSSWKRALLVGDNHIGDILYRSCSLTELKAGLPDCEFYYLAATGSAPLLAGNPAIKSVLPWVRSDSPLDLSPAHMAELKSLQFDAVLSTNPIRYWPELLLALRLGIPNRVGYVYKGFSGLVTHPISINYPQPYPAYFRDYVAALTGQEPVWPLRPRVYPSRDDETAASNVWGRLGLEKGLPVIACFMTTRQGLRVLPKKLIGETLLEIKRNVRCEILLMGAKPDAAVLNEVNKRYELGSNVLAGDLELSALPVFLARCAAVLTADSGPRHLANAAGVPVFFFRNLWSSWIETGAYASNEVDLCPSDAEWFNDTRQRQELEKLLPQSIAAQLLKQIRAQCRQY